MYFFIPEANLLMLLCFTKEAKFSLIGKALFIALGCLTINIGKEVELKTQSPFGKWKKKKTKG